MKVKIGDTLDLVGYKGKRTPVQVINISKVGDHGKEEIFIFTYLDNSGRPNGSCRQSELEKRDQKIEKESSKKEDTPHTEDVVAKTESTDEPDTATADDEGPDESA